MERIARRRMWPDQGFTLVEVIVAMFVLAIVMLAILFVQARALTTNADSQARQESTAVANEAMEQMRAMPWNYLKKGLYSGFVAAAGGDPFVAGSTLTVNGRSYALQVANPLSDQDLSDPWPPLFDSTGSNVQVETSGSGNGSSITVRAYTTADQSGSSDAVGLVVVATWQRKIDGAVQHTVLTSSAYAPKSGCGDLNNAPFLASCQAVFEGNASTARVVIGATATTADGGAVQPLLPGRSEFQVQASTASASARVTSQQFSTAEAFAVFGGVLWDDDNPATQPKVEGWIKGFNSHAIRASDDTTVGAPPAGPVTDGGPGLPDTQQTFTAGSFSLVAEGDEPRTASALASTTSSCSTGLSGSITAGAPCAYGTVGANTSNTGYMSLSIDGKRLRLARVSASGGTTRDDAWAGRFSTVSGNGFVKCATVSGSGCVSAGAQQTFGPIIIGDVQETGNWDAPAGVGSYLVSISNYSDSVVVERGVNQTAAPALFSRSATISYWDGTAYQSYSVNSTSETGGSSLPVGPATWTVPGFATVTATGRIGVAAAYGTPSGMAPCKDDPCTVIKGHGNIVVEITYLIEPDSGSDWALTVVTTVNGSQASASFEESPNA